MTLIMVKVPSKMQILVMEQELIIS